MSAIRPEKFTLKNGTTVFIRSVEVSDWAEQIQFRNTFKNESIFTWHTPDTNPQEEETKRFIVATLAAPKECFIGAFHEKKLIAQIGIHKLLGRDHPWTEHAARFGMTVLKQYWRQGLGFKLLSVMQEEARRMGYRVIHAEVREANTPAIQMYTKFGFEITGTQKKVAFINGRYHNDFLIFKEID